mmetsp:Transcript_59937/g.160618  ORF Transcript_59937/g.160618 Transcript_59937/m.160618 type:complete len:358 (-) Transcript_59937:99-1172(-)
MPRAGVPCLLIDESHDPALVWPSTPTPTGCAQMRHGLFSSGAHALATGPSTSTEQCVGLSSNAPAGVLRIGTISAAAQVVHLPADDDRNGTRRPDGHIRLLGRELLGHLAPEKQATTVEKTSPWAVPPAPTVAPAAMATAVPQVMTRDAPAPLSVQTVPAVAPMAYGTAPAVAPTVCGEPQLQTMPLSLVSLMPVALPVQAPPAGLGGSMLPFGFTGPAVGPHGMEVGAVFSHATAQGPAAQALRLLRLDGVAEPNMPHTVPLASVDVVCLEVRQPQASRGAILHGTGQCRPCAWYWRPQGCSNSQDCCHCHMCPAGEVKARRKARMEALRASGEQSGRSGNGRSRRSRDLRISSLV